MKTHPQNPANAMIVTALRAKERDPHHVDVLVDGELRAVVSAETVHAAGIRPGVEIDGSGIRALTERDERIRVREAALRLLAVRPRTHAELYRRLTRKKFSEGSVTACLERLAEAGLLSDADFAESFVRDRVRFRPRGRRRLRHELRSHGVRTDTADAAIDAVLSECELSDLELAREAARKWVRRRQEDPVRARRRLHGYLARRGFGGEAVQTALEEFLPEVDVEPRW